MESTFFKIEQRGAVAHLSMNRPEKANGMTPDFWSDLPRLTQAFASDPSIRAMVISGQGKHFTGGMDLSVFQNFNAIFDAEPARAAYRMRALVAQYQAAFNALEAAHFPVIAAIHGACIGGGVDMISACDLRLATAGSYFSIEEINIGMTADVGTLQRLPKLIAPGIVKELAFTGRRFSAEEALGWGLLNGVHPTRDETLTAAFALADEIAAKSPLAITGVKRSVDYARDHSVKDSLDQIATWNGGMLRQEDLQNAIQARMAKKQAQFKDLLAG